MNDLNAWVYEYRTELVLMTALMICIIILYQLLTSLRNVMLASTEEYVTKYEVEEIVLITMEDGFVMQFKPVFDDMITARKEWPDSQITEICININRVHHDGNQF